MERLSGFFFERHGQLRSNYQHDLEEQANRFVSGLTFGGEREVLLDAGDKGLILYHHGPEIKKKPRFPNSKEVLTGNEYVFFEYRTDTDYYHIVGSVDRLRQFTLVGVDHYAVQKRRYSPVSMIRYQGVIRSVTDILKEIELPIAYGE